MEHWKHIVWTVVVAFMLAAGLPSAWGETAHRVLAVVGEKVFTDMDVETEVKRLVADNGGASADVLKEQMPRLRTMALEQLIDRELLYLEFKDMKATVPPAYLQRRIDEIVKKEANGDVIAFEDALYARGETMRQFKEKLQRDIAAEMVYQTKVARMIIIKDTDIEAFYREHQELFTVKRIYNIGVIMIAGGPKADEKLSVVQAQLLRTPFELVARKYSDGMNAQEGGDMGWHEDLAPVLAEAISKLKPGEIAPEPVSIGANLYIVKLKGVRGGTLKPLDEELRKVVEKGLLAERLERRFKEYIAELYAKFAVTRMDSPTAGR